MPSKLNISFKKKYLYIALALAAFILSVFYDGAALEFVHSLRTEFWDDLMLFKTNIGLTLISAGLLIYLLATKKYAEIALILLAVALGMEVSYLLKKWTQLPRPYGIEGLNVAALTEASGYSFPSFHATYCLAVIPFLKKIFKKKSISITLMVLLVLIAFSRVYIGVHFMSDVIAGGIIGYTAGVFWLYLQEKINVYEWALQQIKDKRELRRQIAHMLTGIFILFLLRYNIAGIELLIVGLILGGMLSLGLKFYRLPLIYPLVKYFDRPKDLEFFPGKGAFFFFLGAVLSLFLFEKNIAMAAIAIMAVGDSMTAIFGTYFGRIKNPFNPNKHLEGTIIAIICSTLAAFYFVSFEKAFLAATLAMLIESMRIPFLDKSIDDNVAIPMIAGFTMSFML
ncbi:phosphatase PAP2 family protein [Pseudomonadota bacterium]